MIGDITPTHLAVTGFGVQRVFMNLGFAISPAVGGFLATSAGLPALFLFAAITSLIEGVILLVLLRETFRGSRRTGATPTRLSEPFRDRPFVWLLVGLAGLALVMNQFGTPLALFLGSVRSIPLTEFGLIYSLNGVLVVLLQLPVSRLIERSPRYLSWLSGGTLAYGAGFLLFYAAGTFPLYLLAMGVLTLGEDVVSPTQQALVATFGGRERRGSYFGGYNAVTNATRAIGPVVGTLLLGIGPLGPAFLWGGMAAVSVAVALGFVLLRVRTGRRLGPRDPTA
ncbi:Major facilitator superfamily MFS-1, partial [mine drainage metagenome]